MKIKIEMEVSDEEPLISTDLLEDAVQEAMRKFKYVVDCYKFEVIYARPTKNIYS